MAGWQEPATSHFSSPAFVATVTSLLVYSFQALYQSDRPRGQKYENHLYHALPIRCIFLRSELSVEGLVDIFR